MTPLLELRDVSFSWKDRAVLRNASFSLAGGEAIALLGPNGSGKSTLLRLAAGLLTPDSGMVFIEGQPVSDLKPRERARKVALVPQRLQVPFAFTVQQIVEQARTPHVGILGTLTRTDRAAVERALELTDTAIFRNRPMQELSGGEQQRVKIALGLAQGSRLLLLDEPAQSLDVGWQRNLLSTISNLGHEGIAILAAVHELHLVSDFFASALLLDRSKPLQFGYASSILSSQILHDAFYGSHDQQSRSRESNGASH